MTAIRPLHLEIEDYKQTIAGLERELQRTQHALHLMTEAHDLLQQKYTAAMDEIDRLALDLKVREGT